MRNIRLSIAALAGTVACAVACSSSPTTSLSSSPGSRSSTGGSGEPSSPSPSPGAAPSTALFFSLTGDGHSLHLNGAPADPSYVATYPVADLSAMTVTASPVGDLTATCASGGSAVACKSLPFFTEITAKELQVFDAYGHVVMAATPFTPTADAGTASSSDAGGASSSDAGAPSGLGLDAGACAPSVTASLSACTLTVGQVTCDCCDPTCAANAIESCVSSLGVPVGAGAGGFDGGFGGLPGFDDGGFGGLPTFDAGVPGVGSIGDAGAASSACSSAAIAADQAQFCTDVDAWLAAHGVKTTLDCAALGTLSFPATPPAASTASFTCDAATHDAFVKVRAELATCDPLDYIGWDPSAELQLFEDGVCTVW